MTDDELDELEERLPRTVGLVRGALEPEETSGFLGWLRRVKFAQARPDLCEAAAARIIDADEVGDVDDLRLLLLQRSLQAAQIQLAKLNQDALLLDASEQGGRDELFGIVEQLEVALGTKTPGAADRAASGSDDPRVEIKAPYADDKNVCREARGGQKLNQVPPEQTLVIQARRSDLEEAQHTESRTGVAPKKKQVRVRVGTEEETITYGWYCLLRRLESTRRIQTANDRSDEHASLRRLAERANPWGLGLENKGLVWTCGPFALETYEPGSLERDADTNKRVAAELRKDRYGLG